MEKKNDLINAGPSRRTFLAGAGASVGAAALLTGCGHKRSSLPTSGGGTPAVPGISDNDILNFALNLEYLEAEFYLRAATGKGLAAGDIGANPGAVAGGTQVPGLTANQQAYVNEIAFDEQTHVRFLRTALASFAVDRPAIDFTAAFPALAKAAGITVPFDPFSSFDAFLVGAFIFEDVGVTAYHGAAGLLTSKAILTAAAGILATEAYHAASIRTQLTGRSILLPSYPYLDLANKVSDLRAAVGGGKETRLTTPTAFNTPSTIVAADANAVAYARTTDEVLHIVYATPPGAGIAKGGFFPNGLNGKIFTTAA